MDNKKADASPQAISPAFEQKADPMAAAQNPLNNQNAEADTTGWSSQAYHQHGGYTAWGNRHARRGSRGWNSSS